MAMTFEEFVKRTNAEVVAGNIIVGTLGNRKLVGTYDGAFQLNEAGQQMLAELEGTAVEAGDDKPARGRKKAADAEAAEAPAAE